MDFKDGFALSEVVLFLSKTSQNAHFPTNFPHFPTIPFFSSKFVLALSKKRTTMKKILLFALMTFFVQTSFCQNLSDTVNVEYSKNSPKRFSFGISFPSTGVLWTLSPNLNSFLNEKGIPTKNYTPTIPLVLSYQVNKLKLNFEAYYGIMNRASTQGIYSTSLGAELSIFSTEYAIFADRNNYLYLNLGVGHADYTQTITVSNSQPTTFASALQSGGGQTIILKNSSTFLDFGLEFLNRTDKKTFWQSIKAGYRYGLENSSWDSKLVNVTDTPSDRVKGVYFQYLLNIPYRSNFNRPKKN
jgi:hypothetical protein